jgi:L-threonylcarbamoyladenylate synthase
MMNVKKVSNSAVQEAAAAVRDSGTVIYPTETCYGIGCDATDPDTIAEIYDIKQRPQEKGLTAVVADLQMAEQYCTLSAAERAACEAFMPGPLTLVAEKNERVPDALNTAFAFRVPGSEVAQMLPREAGVPVVATSANVSGQPSSYRVDDIDTSVREAVDCIINAGELEQRPSSTVAEIQEDEVVIHRDGPIDRAAIQKRLAASG